MCAASESRKLGMLTTKQEAHTVRQLASGRLRQSGVPAVPWCTLNDVLNGRSGAPSSFGARTRRRLFTPGEVANEALLHSAAGVTMVHDHPSGMSEPSRSDEVLTQTLSKALALIDVLVLTTWG